MTTFCHPWSSHSTPASSPAPPHVIDECHIYSFFNQLLPNGRNAANGLQYDGRYTVDLTTQHNVFVVDCGNTRRQVMVFEDVDDLSKCKVCYCAGYEYKVGGINTNDYTPLGGAPIQIDGAYREVHLTDMYVGPSESSSRFYMPVVGGVNNELPVKKPIANNPIEQVCGFVLYSDSATQDDAGNWTINKDFALPIRCSLPDDRLRVDCPGCCRRPCGRRRPPCFLSRFSCRRVWCTRGRWSPPPPAPPPPSPPSRDAPDQTLRPVSAQGPPASCHASGVTNRARGQKP